MRFVCFFLLFLCIGCNQGVKLKKVTKDNLKVGFVYHTTIHDAGYTTSLDKARIALETQGIQTEYIENVEEYPSAFCRVALEELIDRGCQLIYATSYGYTEAIHQVAKKHPEVSFGHCSGLKTSNNVMTYYGKAFEGRYLAGVVAGLKTKTGKIGYVAAFPIPECIRGINAFALGAMSINPKARIYTTWTSTWCNPEVEKKSALSLLDQGCDIITQHQNTTTCLTAAQERGAYCIGYNIATPNAAPQSYLTAVVFNWANFITRDVKRYLDCKWEATSYWDGLNKGLVDLDKLTSLCEAGTEIKVKDIRGRIENGTLNIFEGPLYDQNDILRVQDETCMSDDEIWNMNWFVKGVIGNIPND